MPLDPETVAARRLAEAWWPVFRSQQVTVKHAIRTAYCPTDPVVLPLRRVILELAPSELADGFVSPHRFGRFLVRIADRPIAVLFNVKPLTFVEREVDRGRKSWQLVPIPVDVEAEAEVAAA